MQIFRLSNVSIKLTKFYVKFIVNNQFSFKFCITLLGVITHNYSEISQLKHYILLTKRAQKSTFFQTFEWSNKSSPNSSCHFCNHKVSVHSNFASLFSLMEDSSSVFFSSYLMYFLQSSPWKCSFSNLPLLKSKFTKSLISFFKQKVSFSSKFRSLFSVMQDHSFTRFLLKLYMALRKVTHQSEKS